MLTTISFVPGAVAAGSNINLPSWAPKIDQVASAFIIRPTSQISIADHAQHSHNLLVTGGQSAGAALQIYPDDVGAVLGKTAATSRTLTGPSESGIQNSGPTTHTVTGGNPVVSATPTKVDEDTITLSADTALGDILYLTYITSGSRLRAA